MKTASSRRKNWSLVLVAPVKVSAPPHLEKSFAQPLTRQFNWRRIFRCLRLSSSPPSKFWRPPFQQERVFSLKAHKGRASVFTTARTRTNVARNL